MPRILFLGDVNSSHIIKWVTSVTEKGFETALFTLSSPQSDWYRDKGIAVFKAGNVNKESFSSLLNKLGYIKRVKKLKQAMALFKPDILHAQYATSYGLLGALSGFEPLLISVWGSDVFDFPQRSFFHKSLLRYNLNSAERIYSTSNVMAEATKKISKKPIYVIPFGVDTGFFQPSTKKESATKEITIGTIKALEKVYGVDILIKAFSRIVNQKPELNLTLLIVGGGTQLSALQKLTNQLSLNDKVTFTGKVGYKDVSSYYKEIDIFANLSRQESFGVSVLEAMACGKPVVVSAVGGLPELVSDDETGLIVKPEDEKSAATAFERLLDDKQLAIRLGLNARDHVRRNFDWNKSVEIMVEQYNEVLEHKLLTN